MAFIRTNKRENPFVQIDKTFAEDPNLTWAAKGLMVYILSRPDNWKINQSDLSKRANDGLASVQSALLNLMLHGYVYFYAERNELGQVDSWVYEVFESPEFNPYREIAQKHAKEKIEKKKAKQKERNLKKQGKTPDSGNTNLDKFSDNSPDSGYSELGNPNQGEQDLGNPNQVYPVLDNRIYNNTDFNNTDFSNNELTNIDSNNNQSINIERIEKLDLPKTIMKVLYKNIDKLIAFQISLDEIELHYNAIKLKCSVHEYSYVLNSFFKRIKQRPDQLDAVLDDWLSRNRAKKKAFNDIDESKPETPKQTKYVREEKMPEYMKNNQVADTDTRTKEEFAADVANLQARLRKKYAKGNQKIQ